MSLAVKELACQADHQHCRCDGNVAAVAGLRHSRSRRRHDCQVLLSEISCWHAATAVALRTLRI